MILWFVTSNVEVICDWSGDDDDGDDYNLHISRCSWFAIIVVMVVQHLILLLFQRINSDFDFKKELKITSWPIYFFAQPGMIDGLQKMSFKFSFLETTFL